MVALRAETGELVWSYQTVHHDVWDYDMPAQPTLARIDTGNGWRDVVIQPTKQGFVFVLDRDTGKPIWPVEERAVPQGGAEGEQLSPTQPFPTHVPALVPQRISTDDVFGVIPFRDSGICREQIASARNEGLYTPPSTQGTVVFPMTGGGVNWAALRSTLSTRSFMPTPRERSTSSSCFRVLPWPMGSNPPPGHDFGRQQGAVRDDACGRAVAFGPVQQAAMGRDGRGRSEGRQNSLALEGRHHGRPRAARHRLRGARRSSTAWRLPRVVSPSPARWTPTCAPSTPGRGRSCGRAGCRCPALPIR